MRILTPSLGAALIIFDLGVLGDPMAHVHRVKQSEALTIL